MFSAVLSSNTWCLAWGDTVMPSDPPVPVTDVAILTALHDRLIAARTAVPNASPPSWNYPLSDVVLPGTGDGNPGAVQTALVSALTPGASTPLMITAASDPVLTVQANPVRVTLLTLTGTSPALTSDPATAVSLVFTVSPALQLQATWRAVPSASWTLASAFGVLAGTAFARLPLSGATFAATTFDHLDGSFYFPLRAGLQFQAFVAVRSDLMPATSQANQPGTQIGGPVQIAANGLPQFAWTGRVPLGPLTIARVGQDPLTLVDGTPALSCTPSSAGAGTVNSLTITGQVTLAGTPVTCVVDLPTTQPGQLNLAATGTVLSAADTTAALAGTGTGDVLTAALPTSVQSLAGVSVTSYGLLFSAAGDQPTTTTVSLAFGADVWSPVAALPLAISGLTLTGTVVRSPQPGTGPLISSNAALAGVLDFAGIHVLISTMPGAAQVPGTLAGPLASSDAASIQVSAVADSTGGLTWAAVTPAGLAASAFTSAAVYLNLSTSTFVLYGAGSSGTVSPGPGLAANGLVYLTAGTAGTWTYAVALAFGPPFQFGSLLPALATADNDVRVASAHLIVCDVASQTLGGLSSATTTLLSQIAPAAPAPLADLAGQDLVLSAGAYFAAQIDFGPVSLFSRILQIGSRGSPPSVWLEAVIPAANPAGTTFSADLPDIAVAGIIVLTHSDAYRGIHLAYTPAQAGSFTLTGRVQLTSMFGSAYAFDAVLTVNQAGLTSTVTPTTQQLASPFGIPGIVVSGLNLTVGYVWAAPTQPGQPASPPSSSYTLGGQVLLGLAPAANQPDQRLSVSATLALLSGEPVLFDIALNADFSIRDFLAQCLAVAAAWPSGFIDVTFQSGTHIYYYAADDDPQHSLGTLNGTARSSGFNVDALIRLTFITDVSVHGLLTVLTDPVTGDYTGVSAAITLDQLVDLAFIQLAGSASPASGGLYTGGPLLAFQTGPQPAFKLSTGINFLGSAFLTADVTVSKGSDGGTIMTGNLTAAQPLTPFGTLGCDFTYTTHPGGDGEFAIGNWPQFTLANIAVDIVNAIKALDKTSTGSLCGTLSDLVANNAFSGSFTVTPSVALSGSNLVFSLTGNYTLTLSQTNSPFVISQPLPAFSIEIPITTTWTQLPGALAAGVADGASNFATDLLNDPKTIAVFLAVVVGPQAVAVALELACKGLVDGTVPTATEAASGAITNASGALVPALIPAALPAAAAAIASLLGGGGGGGNGGGPGGGVVLNPAVGTPQLQHLIYAGGSVTGTWAAAKYAAGYTFELLRTDGTVLAQQDFGLTLTGSLSVDPGPLPAGAYQGQVRGTRGAQTGAWSNQLSLTRGAGPAVTLSYAEPDLVASWPDVGADSYVVRFFDSSGAQLGGDVTVAATVHQASVPLPDPLSGAYAAAVESIMTDHFPSVFGNRATLVVLSLGPPQLGAITRSVSTPTWATPTSGGTLTILWRPGDFAAQGYELRVTMGQVTLASLPTTSIPTLVPLAQPVAAGASLLIQVRARSTAALSPWASATFIAWDVPAPASAQLNDIAGALTASWAAVAATGAPATVYNLQLIQLATVNSGPTVGGAIGASGPPVTLRRYDGGQPAPGTRYAAQVQADIGGNLGPWTTSALVVVATITPPTGVTLTASGATLSLSWAAPPVPPDLTGPLSYDVVLLAGTTKVGESDGVAGVTLSPARSDNQLPAPGQAYTAQVRATTARNASDWATSPAVTVMDVPRLVSVSAGGGTLAVSWIPSTVPGAEYDVGLTQEIIGGTQTVIPVTGPTPSTQIKTTGMPSARYYVQVRARTANSAGAWSAGLPISILAPPTGLAVSGGQTGATVSWNPVPGADVTYTVNLLNLDSTPADSWIVGTQLTYTFASAGTVKPGAYLLTVAANYGSLGTSASGSVPVYLPPPVTG